MARSTRGWTSEGPGPRSRRAGGANSPGIGVTGADSTRAVQTHHVLVCEPPDTRPEFNLRYRRSLVHHQPGDHPEPVRLAGFDGGAEERSVGRIARDSADGDGARCAEPIILNDDDRPRFAGIVLPARSGPHLTALHSSTPAEMVSMNA